MFTKDNLPKFRENSSGHALPTPGASVAVCSVPMATTMETPWGQKLEAEPGRHYHLCLDVASGDHYPNDEFETFYEVTGKLEPAEDVRAAFLSGYWSAKGVSSVEISEATKTKPAIVVGVLDEAGEFENEEGTTNFQPGDVLLESPDKRGRMWIIQAAKFEKKYQGIKSGEQQG